VRRVFAARKKSQQRPALTRDVIANGPTQHRITRFERVEDRVPSHWTINFELHVSSDAGKRA
jgi:hypothetical protein